MPSRRKKSPLSEGALFCLAFSERRAVTGSRIPTPHPALSRTLRVCPALARGPWCPISTQRAQLKPRLACPLYVWKIMQVNDWGRETVPRASAGRAGDNGSFSRSFTFRQILSSLT